MINDIRHVRAFLAAARIGNFTRAAAELHVSQSAFTVQIRQLEDALGVALFDRSKRRVSLTSAGKEVLAPLERLVIDIESLVGRTGQLAGLRRGVVCMAVLPSVAAHTLPLAISKFKQRYPEIVVQVKDVVAESLIDAVKKEEVDFGIGCRLKFDRELRMVPLMIDKLCAFVPSIHLLGRRDTVTFKELSSYPLILPGKDSSVREIMERSLKGERLHFKVAYETNYMSTALGMVRAGLGIAILPEIVANLENTDEIRFVAISSPLLSRKIEILQRKDRSLSPAASEMVQILKEVVARR